MEQLILKVLTFDISVPTIYSFLQHIAVECNLSMRLVSLAQVATFLSSNLQHVKKEKEFHVLVLNASLWLSSPFVTALSFDELDS